MEGRFGHEHEHEEDDTTTTTTTTNTHTTPPENTADSPLSGEEAAEEAYAPSPKKSRRGAQKKVVTVPIADDGFRSKAEVYPPPDNWSWRKYGQKPIKGSPYPRGYYRCSSSKGCPARKQVERSRLDPTTLLVTYSCEHNHPLPTTTKHHHSHLSSAATKPASTTSPSSSSSAATEPPANFPPEECAAFANRPDIEPALVELAGEFGWLGGVGSTMMDGTTLVGPAPWAHAEVEAAFMPIGEEDKLLFGDLGDLPESSVVFRRQHGAERWHGMRVL